MTDVLDGLREIPGHIVANEFQMRLIIVNGQAFPTA
jgi:hypothetical protein